MAATASQVVTIIADDLTGACDTGCLFAGPGPVGVLAPPALTAADSSAITPVITIDTESRPLPPPEAAAAIHAAARRLGGRLASGRVFKKIDSTLRGAAGVELTALQQIERDVESAFDVVHLASDIAQVLALPGVHVEEHQGRDRLVAIGRDGRGFLEQPANRLVGIGLL